MPTRINPYTGEVILTELPQGLAFAGRTNSDMTPSATAVVCAQLAGYGDNYFNNHFYLQVIKAGAAAPESEIRKITNYVSLSGTFTVAAFSQVVDAADEILVIHESLMALGRNDANNVFDSSAVTANEDGSVLERLQWVQESLGGAALQLRTEKSAAGTVEENSYQQFSISLMDIDTGAVLSADIDIASIVVDLAKSTGGAAFSAVGITQPTFVKGDGRVYTPVQFLAAEWQVGDVYRMTVSGITCTVGGDIAYVPAMVWSNMVVEALSLEGHVNAIQFDIGDPSARTFLQSLEAMLGNPDAAGKTLYANLGDFFGQANLQSLLAALGIPDVAGKPLYTCLITDRLDNGTYGLAAIKTLLDAVAGYVDTEIAAIQGDIGDPSSRANLKTLEAMLGNPDAAGKTLYANMGDFFGQANLQSLLAVLGIPDVAGKPLYTCLITDRLDNGTYGLAAIKTLLNAVAGYVDTEIAAIQADIGDPSARVNLKSLEAMLGNPDISGATLYNAHAGTIDAINRVAGKLQVKATTINLAQAAGAYDLFTGTTQDVIVEKLSFRLPNVNVSDDATITSIAIASNDVTPQVLVSSALGVKANLTAEAQLSWTGSVLLKAGKKIQLTISGGAADAATVCDCVAEIRAVTGGGYLA